MQSNRLSSAATSGIVLALISIIAVLLQAVFEPTNKIITYAIWAVKSIGSIWLLYYFMKEYASPFEFFTYKNGFHYGFLLSFFSSIICAAYMFLHYSVLFPDAIAAQTEEIMEMMATSNPNAIDSFEKMIPKMPQIIFISTLIYNTLIGIIASAIIANYTKKGSLFDESTNL